MSYSIMKLNNVSAKAVLPGFDPSIVMQPSTLTVIDIDKDQIVAWAIVTILESKQMSLMLNYLYVIPEERMKGRAKNLLNYIATKFKAEHKIKVLFARYSGDLVHANENIHFMIKNHFNPVSTETIEIQYKLGDVRKSNLGQFKTIFSNSNMDSDILRFFDIASAMISSNRPDDNIIKLPLIHFKHFDNLLKLIGEPFVSKAVLEYAKVL